MIHLAFKAAPLNTTFVIAALVGLAFSIFYLPKYTPSFAFAATIVFLCMLIASFISMTRASEEVQLGVKAHKHKR